MTSLTINSTKKEMLCYLASKLCSDCCWELNETSSEVYNRFYYKYCFKTNWVELYRQEGHITEHWLLQELLILENDYPDDDDVEEAIEYFYIAYLASCYLETLTGQIDLSENIDKYLSS